MSPSRQSRSLAAAWIALSISCANSVHAANESTSLCAPRNGSSAYYITTDCIDETYQFPVIDYQVERSEPAQHTWVSGHFDNTSVSFNFYLPPADSFQGRFFQWAYPTQASNASSDDIAFGLDSGAYFVQVQGVPGYRAEAAAAKYSRIFAQSFYGGNSTNSTRIYGYLHGASGGSYQTVGGIENTVGVWDGAVPIVQAIPVSAPDGPSARAMAGFLLHDKISEIQEAIKPGGSGDPYKGLNQLQHDALREATLLGIPLRTWEDFNYVGNRSTLYITSPTISAYDSSYGNDFWTKPGYLGTEQSPLGDVFRKALVDYNTTIRATKQDDKNTTVVLELEGVPEEAMPQFDTYGFDFTAYATNGSAELGQFRGFFNQTTKVVELTGSGLTNDEDVIRSLSSGTRLNVNNRLFLAAHAYYRYQVPARAGFIGFDQFRDANGTSIYPVRPVDVSKSLSESVSGGGTHTGNITGKVIVVHSLLDSDAWPWHAHWYKTQVEQSLGDKFDDNYRIFYTDHTEHGWVVEGSRATFIVDYLGVYQQALRDLSAWVEDGITPPASSNYTLTSDNDITLPENASERGGIQPTVHLSVAGDTNCSISAGDAVLFSAKIETPPQTGKVVSVEWDYFGTGDFVDAPFGSPNETVTVASNFTYTVPGDYIAGLRVSSERNGKTNATFARAYNIARVRVIVE